jgi:hydrogenase/urease accessory protein HupE
MPAAAFQAALLFSTALMQAHEFGTSRVSVLFPGDRTYEIVVVTDADALAEKLGAPVTASEEKFRQRVKIEFDGIAVHPSLAAAVTPAIDATSAPAATIRLTGPDPATCPQLHLDVRLDLRHLRLEGGEQHAMARRQPAELTVLLEYASRAQQHRVALSHARLQAHPPQGLDHMLFVLGIYLLSRRARSVLVQVSAFTVAHSITLGLSMYGLVSVSPRIVEPMIAISIAYVAIENLFFSELKSWRVVLVFAFGLLHGLGFAGALRELGLPRSEFLTALLSFNVGVEAGQLAVIAAAFMLVGWHYSNRTWYRSRIVVPASLMIACTAVYWTIERLTS